VLAFQDSEKKKGFWDNQPIIQKKIMLDSHSYSLPPKPIPNVLIARTIKRILGKKIKISPFLR
jgi:hypothetical protein